MIRLTPEIMFELGGPFDGFTRKSLAVLGITELKSGWKHLILNREFPEDVFNKFYELSKAHRERHPIKSYQHVERKYIPKIKPEPVKVELSESEKAIKGTQEMRARHAKEYCSMQWQRKKTAIMVRDNFVCSICGATDRFIHVHHLRYIPGCKVWEVDDKYLVCVCVNCHDKLHPDHKIKQKSKHIYNE